MMFDQSRGGSCITTCPSCRWAQLQMVWRCQDVSSTRTASGPLSSSCQGTGPLSRLAQIPNGASSGAWGPGQHTQCLLSSMPLRSSRLVRHLHATCLSTSSKPAQRLWSMLRRPLGLRFKGVACSGLRAAQGSAEDLGCSVQHSLSGGR